MGRAGTLIRYIVCRYDYEIGWNTGSYLFRAVRFLCEMTGRHSSVICSWPNLFGRVGYDLWTLFVVDLDYK